MSDRREEPQFRRLPLGVIDPPAQAMRETMDAEKLEELTRDVQVRGVRLPLEVLMRESRYEIISGHRRYVAAERALLLDVPCLVYTSRHDEIEADRYLENVLREDVPPAQEAKYLACLLETRCGSDTNRLAAYVHKRREYVEDLLLLLEGHEVVFQALEAGAISKGHARELNKCADVDHVKYLIYQVQQFGATIPMVRQMVDQWRVRSQAPVPGAGAADEPTASAPVLIDDYFTCAFCGETKDRSRMRPLNVHDYCWLATLKRLIEAWHAGEIRL